MKKFLILENGQIFEGKAFGAPGEVVAEIVFSTSMVGYIDALTDLSYTGQALVSTFPLMGNYGIINSDVASKGFGAKALIVREWCEQPSNFRTEGTLDGFMKEHGIVGLYGIDTRALTRVLREQGVMNGVICDTPDPDKVKLAKAYSVNEPVDGVTTKTAYEVKSESSKYKVAVLDFGIKNSMIKSLTQRGCDLTVLPAKTPAKDILALAPDGIFLSNGPGNPKDNTEVISNLKELAGNKIPTFGVCLGHQLLALSHGFDTFKLTHGHRGGNQPVRCTETGKTYISTQNHGYAVVDASIDQSVATKWFENVNDGTNEGLIYKNCPTFSAQFHPEAASNQNDTLSFLYNKFIDVMEERKCR